MLNQPSKKFSAVGPWIQEIKQMLDMPSDFKVSWVRRTANVAAYKLARVRVGEELCMVWLGFPPDCVLDIISDDIPSFNS
jgi:hypothetical protein